MSDSDAFDDAVSVACCLPVAYCPHGGKPCDANGRCLYSRESAALAKNPTEAK